MIRKLRKVIGFSRERKTLIMINVILSLYVRLMDIYRPESVRPDKFHSGEGNGNLSPAEDLVVKDMSYAIRLVAKLAPWKNECRHQSWQAAFLLSRAGIGFDYFVGAKKDAEGRMVGHSWILAGRRFVCGKCNPQEYSLISYKSDRINETGSLNSLYDVR